MKLNDVVQKIKEQQQQSLMETTTFKEKIGSLEDQVEMLTAREKQLTMEKQQVLDQNTSLSREMEDMKKVSLYWLFFFPF
jgi:chromosome segregation ATPase